MVEAQGLRATDRPSDRVVRPIAAAGGRTCARPGCPAPARATLTFAYDAKTARLGALLPQKDPASYDLCAGHADRTSPPFGWALSDQRPPESDVRPVDLADEDRTVAVISAALRAVPNLPEPAASPPDAGQDAGFDAGFDVGLDASLDASPAAPSQPASTPAPNRSLTRTLEPRPVLAVAAPSTDADELAELADAVEALAGAEVEVALAELSELDAVAAARDDVPADVPVTVSAEPAVWTAPVDGEGASELLALTLPFSDEPAPSGARVDDASHDEAVHADDLPYDEDAPLTPEGHAQAW